MAGRLDFLVPRRPEALIAKETAERGDSEKVATALSPSIVVKGVLATSRYQKHDELAVMAEWIWALSPWLRPLVATVFCDSKAGWDFTITCRRGNPAKWQDWYGFLLGETLEDVCIEREGGHNGIWVKDHRGGDLYVKDPDWGNQWGDEA